MLAFTLEAYKLGMPIRCILSSLRGSRDLVSDSRNTFTQYFKAIYMIKLLPHILVFKELYKNLRVGGVGFEPTHPLGKSFTDSRSSPTLPPAFNNINIKGFK